MNKSIFSKVFVAGIFCLLCFQAKSEPAKTAEKCDVGRSLPRLHADGKYIYDSCGRVALLRGVNVPGYHTYPFTYGAEDAKTIKSFGFNFIRLGVSWQYAEPKEGEYDRAYMESVVNFMRAAREQGIYVMPEVHQIGWGAPDGGIPAWMCKKPPKNGGDLLAVARESGRFWNSPELQEKMLGFWKYLLKNFQGLDNIFGYNVMNEPGSVDCAIYGAFETKLFPFYERAIAIFRENDPQIPVILEPCVFALIFPADTRPFKEGNVVFSPHPYFFHSYTGSGKLVVVEREPNQELAEKYERLLIEGKQMNAPVLIGEYGGPESRKFAKKWLEKNLELQDKYFLGAAIWAFDQEDQNWSVVDPQGQPRQYYWQMLRRAYPRFTAGTPIELFFSPDKREFSYRFLANPSATAPTEIYIPSELMKKSPLKISGAGGRYDEKTETLFLWNEAGAGEVRVELKF